MPLSTLDFEDLSFVSRDQVRPPGGSEDFLVEEGGVVDGSYGEDPITLLDKAGTSRMSIVAGWGRLLQMKEIPKIGSVIALVLRDVSDEEAAIYAARANLSHGRMLTKTEKRRCFDREQAAIAAGKFARPTICALARAYGASRNTIKGWLKSSRSSSRSAGSASGKKRASRKNERRSLAPNNDAILADLVAATSLLTENVTTTPLSNEQAVELKKAIASLQQLLVQPNRAGETA